MSRKVKQHMRPMLAYYGGKQRLVPKLLPLIPPHAVYVEPFCGGASLFFARQPEVRNQSLYREVLNDKDERVISVFRAAQKDAPALWHKLQYTPYSRAMYKEARQILRERWNEASLVDRAWAVIVSTKQGFADKIDSSWGIGVYTSNHAAEWVNYRKRFFTLVDRLASVYIECDDAISVIKRWDSPQTFFYCDPPYPNTDQSGYAHTYSVRDFARLVETLDEIEGAFMLSCYDSHGVAIPDDWERFSFAAHCTASGEGKTGNKRDRSRAATGEELGKRKREEIVYRRERRGPLRPELARILEPQASLLDDIATPEREVLLSAGRAGQCKTLAEAKALAEKAARRTFCEPEGEVKG